MEKGSANADPNFFTFFHFSFEAPTNIVKNFLLLLIQKIYN